jgi:glycosyltransferase involved in cell wall biosynthesis
MDKEMNLKCVSILIPVHNRNMFIAECIQSALDQTYTNIEVVVVDNASDDGTWEICQQFANLDSRVRIFQNEKNIGPVRNWKRCAEEARGEYSKILFSDDLLEKNCIEQMVNHLNSLDVGLVNCSAYVGKTKENSKILYQYFGDETISTEIYIKKLINREFSVGPGSVLIRSKDLKRHIYIDFPTATPRNYSENGAGPDVMIMLNTSLQYTKIKILNAPLVFFRNHEKSFTVMNTNNSVNLGWDSAISYFLKTNKMRNLMINFIAKNWLLEIKKGKKWKNPINYLKEFEGSGSLFELINFSWYIIIIIIKFLVKRN